MFAADSENLMYCEKCGADNSETAKFCRKCGGVIEAEEETRVATRPAVERGDAETPRPWSDQAYLPPRPRNADNPPSQGGEPEAEIFSLSPTLLFVKAGYLAAAIGALFLVAIVSVFLPTIVSTWVAVLFGLMLFLIPAFYHFKRMLIKYTLTDSKLEIDTGLVSRTTRNIPIGRIQDVTVSANMVQRLLGFGDIMIDNASDLGGKAILKNINSPKHYADLLLKQMRQIER
jgi:membrane protein YdbS with pleckstrin-like domain